MGTKWVVECDVQLADDCPKELSINANTLPDGWNYFLIEMNGKPIKGMTPLTVCGPCSTSTMPHTIIYNGYEG